MSVGGQHTRSIATGSPRQSSFASATPLPQSPITSPVVVDVGSSVVDVGGSSVVDDVSPGVVVVGTSVVMVVTVPLALDDEGGIEVDAPLMLVVGSVPPVVPDSVGVFGEKHASGKTSNAGQ